ncbi:hypothetical protein H0H93_015313 [Arthromyces matolae]|nr:hypothetical protein H0H93_015313 [Arthromyces matolae]
MSSVPSQPPSSTLVVVLNVHQRCSRALLPSILHQTLSPAINHHHTGLLITPDVHQHYSRALLPSILHQTLSPAINHHHTGLLITPDVHQHYSRALLPSILHQTLSPAINHHHTGLLITPDVHQHYSRALLPSILHQTLSPAINHHHTGLLITPDVHQHYSRALLPSILHQTLSPAINHHHTGLLITPDVHQRYSRALVPSNLQLSINRTISHLFPQLSSVPPRRSNNQCKTYGIQGLKKQADKAEKRYEQNIKGLSNESRQILQEIQGVLGSSNVEPDPIDQNLVIDDGGMAGDWEDVDDNDESNNLPKEYLARAARDFVDSRFRSRYRTDARTWRQRIQRQQRNWEPLMEQLTDAYLAWRYTTASLAPETEAASPDYDHTLTIIDLYSLETRITIHRTENSTSLAVDIVRHGYLGTTPSSPSTALSLRTLELYYLIRRRRASFSIEAFAKVLCDLYKLEDEPPLSFSRMFAIDGNNSLKRVRLSGDRQVGDLRTFKDSDYYLDVDFVEKFANEVKKSTRTEQPTEGPTTTITSTEPSSQGPISDMVPDDSMPGDPTDSITAPTDPHAPCADNWKAAANENNKKMWAIFDESGIFASACRHGFILWIIDMVRSGELAKYPLAIIAKALEVLPPQFLVGYDIGCILEGTISRSSMASLFEERQCRCCVNAFHGYSHNFQCQVRHHPNIIQGMGLEDLETMERVFSASNQLATVTRYMSKHRRRVFIDIFFHQWDNEKYENLGTMLYNNYTQALEIINVDGPEHKQAMHNLQINEGDLELWRLEQKTYFSSLGREPEEHALKIAYVERLQELRAAEELYRSANSRFLISTPNDAAAETYSSGLSSTRKRETERRYADERRDQLTRDVIVLEEKLGIGAGERWTFSSPQFLEISQYMSRRKYEKALDKLQKLVIQRLFELQKLNLSQTGYKMRTHIAKSLQTRCAAIRTAVAAYNKAALELDPPRATLDWSRVSHYTFLEDFVLLRDTGRDIKEKPWTQPVIREMIQKDQRIKRAHEEVTRCNIEVRRLHTSIVDENRHFTTCLQTLKDANNPIYGAVYDYITYRRRVNTQLLRKIYQIYSLADFSGVRGPGVKKGAMSEDDGTVNLGQFGNDTELRSVGDEHDALPDAEGEDDEEEEDLNSLVNFIGGLDINS